MKILANADKQTALVWLEKVAEIARQATCQQVRYASAIVADGQIIGHGFNSPPGALESQRRCQFQKDHYHQKVVDKTCCVHAEQRAIIDALKNFPEKIIGSQIYTARIDEDGRSIKCGLPYCTVCSKMVLDVGIKDFILYQDAGVCLYDTEEYNNLSFNYNG